MKKGATLVEVVVAMGLFAILSTIIIGAYVMVLNMKALTSSMKENQQKLRTALELTSRLGRQANQIEIRDNNVLSSNGKTVILYFEPAGGSFSASKFVMGPMNTGEKDTLYIQDGTYAADTKTWSWSTGENLLGGSIALDATSKFILFSPDGSSVTNPPTLTLRLNGKIGETVNNSYYKNDLAIENTVILESLWPL